MSIHVGIHVWYIMNVGAKITCSLLSYYTVMWANHQHITMLAVLHGD